MISLVSPYQCIVLFSIAVPIITVIIFFLLPVFVFVFFFVVFGFVLFITPVRFFVIQFSFIFVLVFLFIRLFIYFYYFFVLVLFCCFSFFLYYDFGYLSVLSVSSFYNLVFHFSVPCFIVLNVIFLFSSVIPFFFFFLSFLLHFDFICNSISALLFIHVSPVDIFFFRCFTHSFSSVHHVGLCYSSIFPLFFFMYSLFFVLLLHNVFILLLFIYYFIIILPILFVLLLHILFILSLYSLFSIITPYYSFAVLFPAFVSFDSSSLILRPVFASSSAFSFFLEFSLPGQYGKLIVYSCLLYI